MPLVLAKHALRLDDADGNEYRIPFSPEIPIIVPEWISKHPDYKAYLSSGTLVESQSPLIIPAGFKQILVPDDSQSQEETVKKEAEAKAKADAEAKAAKEVDAAAKKAAKEAEAKAKADAEAVKETA